MLCEGAVVYTLPAQNSMFITFCGDVGHHPDPILENETILWFFSPCCYVQAACVVDLQFFNQPLGLFEDPLLSHINQEPLMVRDI